MLRLAIRVRVRSIVALGALLAVSVGVSCSTPESTVPLPSAPPAPTAEPSPGELKTILTDLGRWDAATTHARRAAAEGMARREPEFALLRLETFSCGGQTHEVAIYSHAKTGLEFVLVPGRAFLMGSPAREVGRPPDTDNETQHTVTLTRPFLIARTECTQAAYQRVMGTNPSYFRGAKLPVEQVSWEDSKAFCDSVGLELPSEAQWEWACRAGTTTPWSIGDDKAELASAAWHAANSGNQTHPAAQRAANAFGLYDVHGNVSEWCSDWYVDHPTGSVTDPTRLQATGYRVERGGSFRNGPAHVRSANRAPTKPGFRWFSLGFRPARTVAPS